MTQLRTSQAAQLGSGPSYLPCDEGERDAGHGHRQERREVSG